MIRRFDVYLVKLDPAVRTEMRKTRPCLVVSPDEMNRYLKTVIVAPMTTRVRAYPTCVPCRFRGRRGEVALDQLRTIDRSRLGGKLGRLGGSAPSAVLSALAEMFAP